MVTLAMSIAILFSLTCRMFWVDYQTSFSKGEMDNAVGLNSDFDWYAVSHVTSFNLQGSCDVYSDTVIH